jgi:hypothetical protein
MAPEFRRDLGLCLARLAVAYAGSKGPDNAVAVAQQSLTIAANTRSRRTAGQPAGPSYFASATPIALGHPLEAAMRQQDDSA